MMVTSLGLDPGTHGGMALICDGNLEFVMELNKHSTARILQAMRDFKKCWPNLPVFMEGVHARKGDTPKTAGGLMYARGWLDCCLSFADIDDAEKIDPQVWQREFSLGGMESYAARKSAAWEQAKAEFPGVKILKPAADSVLLALYGFRKQTNALKPKTIHDGVKRGAGLIESTEFRRRD